MIANTRQVKLRIEAMKTTLSKVPEVMADGISIHNDPLVETMHEGQTWSKKKHHSKHRKPLPGRGRTAGLPGLPAPLPLPPPPGHRGAIWAPGPSAPPVPPPPLPLGQRGPSAGRDGGPPGLPPTANGARQAGDAGALRTSQPIRLRPTHGKGTALISNADVLQNVSKR